MNYPCKDCKKNKNKCSVCSLFRIWFSYQWKQEVEPFRKLKEERDKQRQKQDQKEQQE